MGFCAEFFKHAKLIVLRGLTIKRRLRREGFQDARRSLGLISGVIMNIAVTGGSGNIGSAVVRALRERGHDVLSLDIRPPKDAATNPSFAVLDLRAPSAVRRAFDGKDVVLHLGELPGVLSREPADVFTHNTQIGSSVMEIAVHSGVQRIVYTSTCQTYGTWGDDSIEKVPPAVLPMDETQPLRPQNAYALSKACNEQYAQMLVRKHNVPIAAFRFPAVFSAENFDRMGEWLARRGMKKMVHDGFGTYLHVDDAAQAYVLATEKGWSGFEAYHFVADDVLSAKPIREVLLELYPATPLPTDWPDFASPVLTTKVKNHFGWQPKHSLRQTVLDAIEKAKTPVPSV